MEELVQCDYCEELIPRSEKADHEFAHKLEIEQDIEEHKGEERRPKKKRTRLDKAKDFIEKTATRVFKSGEKSVTKAIKSAGDFISKVGDKISSEI